MKMQSLSFRLAKALAQGRSPGAHRTREEIVAALLAKRAAAKRAGLTEQEALLRAQILWALPVRHLTRDESQSPASAES